MSDQAPVAAGATRLPAFAAAFGSVPFRRLWIGAFLSSIGTWTQDVALAWIVHERFGDPRFLGYRSFAAEAPLLAFMLLGGAQADRSDRRRILLTSQVLQMAFAAVLALLYFWGSLGIGWILGLAFLTGLAQSQSAPTYQATLTSLVPRPHIQSAVALNSLQFNLSRAVGPAIAALFLAGGGAGLCFAVNALSYVAVIVSLAAIRIPPPTGHPTESVLRSVVSAWREVADTPILRVLVFLGAAGSFLAFPLITYLPVVASGLGAGASGFSLLLSSFGAGAIAGAVVTAHRGHTPGRGGRLLVAFAACGLMGAAAVVSPRRDVAALLLAVAGFSMVTAFSTLNGLVQEAAPESHRGRVLSIFGLAFRGGGPFGALVAGFLVRAYGAAPTLALFGIGLILLAAGVRRQNEALRGV